MPQHDPVTFTSGLAARLAARTRHVCLFLGAGVAKASGLPDIATLEERVASSLEGDDAEVFDRLRGGRNIEQVLSRLRRIVALVDGEDRVGGLTAAEADELDGRICAAIVGALSLKGADLEPMSLLAAWVRRAEYHDPVEIFTVNYDLLIETALERQRAPYFDGFVGNLHARFQPELVEEWPNKTALHVSAAFARLWKLHGSLNWTWTDEVPKQIVRLGQPVSGGGAAAVYPSDTKYEESRRVPFVILQDRFRRALHKPETILLVSGYSFSDQHLNELMFDAAARRQRSEIIAFCYGEIPEALEREAVRNPNLQAVSGTEAIIGGVKGEWLEPKSPPAGVWKDAAFALQDFREFAGYLARSSKREGEHDPRLDGLLEQDAPNGGDEG